MNPLPFDQSHIVTIAVTAAITAAITVTVTLALTGVARILVELVKTSPTAERAKQVIRTLFHTRLRGILWLGFLFVMNIWVLISAMRRSTPITRATIFHIALNVTVSEVIFCLLLVEIALWRIAKRK